MRVERSTIIYIAFGSVLFCFVECTGSSWCAFYVYCDRNHNNTEEEEEAGSVKRQEGTGDVRRLRLGGPGPSRGCELGALGRGADARAVSGTELMEDPL